MTQEEFYSTNWHRGNMVKLDNGKEYLVKGIKSHGNYLLLYSWEYDACFIADHNIIAYRTSDYEEPEEIYLEMKRRKQEEAQERMEAERQERLRLKEERKQRNLQEQERQHQEALARKVAKSNAQAQKITEKSKPEPKKASVQEVQSVNKTEAQSVNKTETQSVVAPEATPAQPKRKRVRITVKRSEKVKY